MVARGMHGCQGGMHGCQGGVHGWGHSWLQGAWVVARGYAWLPQCVRGCGGICGCVGSCVVAGGRACMGYDEIRSMSGRYASYWNAFLLN